MRHLAIMQPYIFPYIGYFQLIQVADQFVFYNDVNFIKKGWIHRNRILLNGKDFLFTIPCAEISQNKRICDTRLAFDKKEKGKLLATIAQAYKKAPFFEGTYALVERVIGKEFNSIDELSMESVKEVCHALNISTCLTQSKDCYANEELKKEDRLIDICHQEEATSYINPVGGQEIYTKEYFIKQGILLRFIKPDPIAYRQFENEFVPWLSIIDVLMFNEHKEVIKYLNKVELL
jgi:hypothetical protein